jgi:hypothetical protein
MFSEEGGVGTLSGSVLRARSSRGAFFTVAFFTVAFFTVVVLRPPVFARPVAFRARAAAGALRFTAFGRLADRRDGAGFRPAFAFLTPALALRLAIVAVLSVTLTVLR